MPDTASGRCPNGLNLRLWRDCSHFEGMPLFERIWSPIINKWSLMIRNLAFPILWSAKFQLETYRPVRSLASLAVCSFCIENAGASAMKKLSSKISKMPDNRESSMRAPFQTQFLAFWLQHQTVDDPQRQFIELAKSNLKRLTNALWLSLPNLERSLLIGFLSNCCSFSLDDHTVRLLACRPKPSAPSAKNTMAH